MGSIGVHIINYSIIEQVMPQRSLRVDVCGGSSK